MLQLYYDFSGYSDMAVGLGAIMGINLPRNFDHPYMAMSIAEYWRKWHITLGEWFRDYVYTPCARILIKKNFIESGKKRILVCDGISLFIVWILTGIWHGSGIKFIVYGLWFFLFILYERLRDYYRKERRKRNHLPARKNTVLQRLTSRILTIVAVIFGQVIFRADSLENALRYWKRMLVWNTSDGLLLLYHVKNYTVFILIAGFVFMFPIYGRIRSVFDKNNTVKLLYRLFLLCVFIVAFCYAISDGYTSFLYEVF